MLGILICNGLRRLLADATCQLCQSGRIGFLATDATNSPEACCVRLEWHLAAACHVCMSHSCQLPASLGP